MFALQISLSSFTPKARLRVNICSVSTHFETFKALTGIAEGKGESIQCFFGICILI